MLNDSTGPGYFPAKNLSRKKRFSPRRYIIYLGWLFKRERQLVAEQFNHKTLEHGQLEELFGRLCSGSDK